jgi:uncharacterized protein YegL
MNYNYLKIIFFIDESGSMSGTESDVTGGFNNFIEQQRAQQQGRVTVSLYKFNNSWSRVLNDLPIEEIRPLTSADYTPGGLTALYDTIGHAITDIGNQIRYSKEEDRPSMVMMAIITDGQENASREYDAVKIRQMIHELEQNGNWQFIYLGAEVSNFSDADSMGVYNKIAMDKTKMKSKFDVISEHTMRFKVADLGREQEKLWSDFMKDLSKEKE